MYMNSLVRCPFRFEALEFELRIALVGVMSIGCRRIRVEHQAPILSGAYVFS